jgi:glyoxylase-like metal-dependent hydrolase (beta-lactamase superfamily II)
MLKIGDIEIHLINDCRVLVDGGGAFGLVPRVLWQRYFTPDDDNLIPMNQTCLFVRVGGKNIVVDTGLGTKLNDKARRIFRIENEGGLLRGLAELGIQPADIDLVIDTHLHSDHAGGNTRFVEGSTTEVEPTFPNAEYVVQRREYEDAMRPNERTAATYFPFNYQPLVESGQMRLLDGDGEFLPGITGIITPGHTPAHMSIRFESNGEHAMFLCDMACYAVHFERLGWMTAYDVEPLRTMETKRVWQKWALENDAIVIFPHDVKRTVGRLLQAANGAITVEPIDEPYVNKG